MLSQRLTAAFFLGLAALSLCTATPLPEGASNPTSKASTRWDARLLVDARILAVHARTLLGPSVDPSMITRCHRSWEGMERRANGPMVDIEGLERKTETTVRTVLQDGVRQLRWFCSRISHLSISPETPYSPAQYTTGADIPAVFTAFQDASSFDGLVKVKRDIFPLSSYRDLYAALLLRRIASYLRLRVLVPADNQVLAVTDRFIGRGETGQLTVGYLGRVLVEGVDSDLKTIRDLANTEDDTGGDNDDDDEEEDEDLTYTQMRSDTIGHVLDSISKHAKASLVHMAK